MKNPILKTGIIFGVVVEIWALIFAAAGMHRSPSLGPLFSIVAIVLTVAFVAWGLVQTKALGKKYMGQVVSGVLICLVAAVIIFFGSLLLNYVVFPDFIQEAVDVQMDIMAQRGMAQEEIEQQMSMTSFLFTPIAQAILGVVGTMVTGLIVSLILAIFIRQKD